MEDGGMIILPLVGSMKEPVREITPVRVIMTVPVFACDPE